MHNNNDNSGFPLGEDEELDCYSILGVEETASAADIRKAYMRLALKHHPDKNLGNESSSEILFKQIVYAYEVLSNEKTRQAYDGNILF